MSSEPMSETGKLTRTYRVVNHHLSIDKLFDNESEARGFAAQHSDGYAGATVLFSIDDDKWETLAYYHFPDHETPPDQIYSPWH